MYLEVSVLTIKSVLFSWILFYYVLDRVCLRNTKWHYKLIVVLFCCFNKTIFKFFFYRSVINIFSLALLLLWVKFFYHIYSVRTCSWILLKGSRIHIPTQFFHLKYRSQSKSLFNFWNIACKVCIRERAKTAPHFL